MRAAIKLLVLYLCLLPLISSAQADVDTLRIAGCSYIRYHKGATPDYNTIVKDDSVLVVCDSAGVVKQLQVSSWTLAMTIDSAYVDFNLTGEVVPQKQGSLLAKQPSGGWICIERVVAVTANGEKIKLPAEKWVKL